MYQVRGKLDAKVRELPQELSSVQSVSLFDRGKTVLALPVPSSVKTKVCLKWKVPRATFSAVDRKYNRFKVLFEAILAFESVRSGERSESDYF